MRSRCIRRGCRTRRSWRKRIARSRTRAVQRTPDLETLLVPDPQPQRPGSLFQGGQLPSPLAAPAQVPSGVWQASSKLVNTPATGPVWRRTGNSRVQGEPGSKRWLARATKIAISRNSGMPSA